VVKTQSLVTMLITENGRWMNLNSSNLNSKANRLSLNMVQMISVMLSVFGIENQFQLLNILLVLDSQAVHVHTVKCISMASALLLSMAASSNMTEKISLCDMAKNTTMTATMNSIAKKMVLISIVKFTVQLISVTLICVLEILIASTLGSIHVSRMATR